ncbi:MAG: hypothetical protein FJ299_06180 [Planctomycetes bacterium]|nr:hypothetical protein [Planctomycetota bacterium]
MSLHSSARWLPRHAALCFVVLPLLLACALLGSRAAAQFTNPGSSDPQRPNRRSLLKLATQFSWDEMANFTGPVDVPVGPGGGWLYLSGYALRLVPSVPGSTDPIAQLILYPPNSGHPTLAEDVLIQFPLGPAPAGGWPVLIGFHPYNVSHASLILNTQFPQLCAQKGYVLISPYGMSQYNFANPTAQNALDKTLELIRQWIPLDPTRIYTVGFSMGSLNAVSWAMRHLDPSDLRVAGVIVHTGTQDVIEEYNTAPAAIKNQLAEVFGGTPLTVPFAYDRVNPLRMLAGAADPDQTNVTNLLHVPFYVNVNLGDPNVKLVTQTNALANFLISKGALVNFQAANFGPTHSWNTLNFSAALDWIDNFTLPADPQSVELWSDDIGQWLQTEVRAQDAQKVARYKLAPSGSNALALTATRFLGELAFDARDFGASYRSLLKLDTSSADGTSDTLVLTGYPSAPSSVALSGGGAVQSWSYSAALQELRVIPHPSGSPVQVLITP